MLTDVRYGTIRPSKDDSTPQWGNIVLGGKNEGGKGFRDYCKLKPCSNEGLKAIARYNGFDKEWEQETALFTESTSLA